MMKAIKLGIRPFKNHNGAISWRVSGMMYGTRIRRNFKDKADALAEKRCLEIKAMQDTSGLRVVGTFLSDPQLREAEAVFLRLEDVRKKRELEREQQRQQEGVALADPAEPLDQPSSPPSSPFHSLTFCVDYMLANYTEPVANKPLSKAQQEYCKQREADHAKGLLSSVHLDSIQGHMRRLDEFFPKISMVALSAEKITQFCEQGSAGFKTHNNRRHMVSTFLKFAENQGWLPTGEAEKRLSKVPCYATEHKRGSASTLSVAQSKELMAFLETYEGGRLVPHYALCLFAGIRPDAHDGEISKLRAEDIHLETSVIHVEPEVSKVDMKRNVTIQPNLMAWLRAYPVEKHPLIIPSMLRHRAIISKKFNLPKDVLRHTFISMHVAKFRSMGDTALQAGNSEGIIRKHYLAVKSPAEAEEFWGIVPKRGEKQEAPVEERSVEDASEPLATTA